MMDLQLKLDRLHLQLMLVKLLELLILKNQHTAD